MSKVSEFYSKAVSEETSAKKLAEILGDKDMSEASDEQLLAVGKLASELGYDITIDEAKAFLSDGELDEDDLDAVAGGKGSVTITTDGENFHTVSTGDTGDLKVYTRVVDHQNNTDTGYQRTV